MSPLIASPSASGAAAGWARKCSLLVLLACCFLALFAFGSATAAYQIEGSWNVDGKQPSEWDLFSHLPGKVANGDSGDIADRGYELALADVKLLRAMGVNAYRFSLSWSRIIDVNGDVNPAGVKHYSELIDALIDADIAPWITLYHWDLPLSYGTLMGLDNRGWLNATYLVPLFTQYADACFSAFGDRVEHWMVVNEPHSFCVGGFASGSLAPGRCSDRSRCDAGDSTTEPYQCAHTVLLVWASVVNLYRSKYAPSLGDAQFAIALDAIYAVPLTSSAEDVAAAERAMVFQLAWWADPLFTEEHDYPAEMRSAVGDRLPTLTAEDKAALHTARPDFFAYNHYTTSYSFAETNSTDPFVRDQTAGSRVTNLEGELIGAPAASSWLYVVPWGFPLALKWINTRYPGVPIVITENGVDVAGESKLPLPEVLQDDFRVDYLRDYLDQLTRVAIGQMGLPVLGYFVWSLLDNFEWADGYQNRFGMHYVDYTSGECTRYNKSSATWYASWIAQQKAESATADERVALQALDEKHRRE